MVVARNRAAAVEAVQALELATGIDPGPYCLDVWFPHRIFVEGVLWLGASPGVELGKTLAKMWSPRLVCQCLACAEACGLRSHCRSELAATSATEFQGACCWPLVRPFHGSACLRRWAIKKLDSGRGVESKCTNACFSACWGHRWWCRVGPKHQGRPQELAF